MRQDDGKDLSAIVSTGTNPVGAHDVDEDVFVAAALNKSRRFMRAMTISSATVTFGGISRQNRCVNSLMPALAHTTRCRPKGA